MDPFRLMKFNDTDLVEFFISCIWYFFLINVCSSFQVLSVIISIRNGFMRPLGATEDPQTFDRKTKKKIRVN